MATQRRKDCDGEVLQASRFPCSNAFAEHHGAAKNEASQQAELVTSVRLPECLLLIFSIFFGPGYAHLLCRTVGTTLSPSA